MRILNIVPSTSARGGGVFNAAFRHHECLRSQGMDSHIYTRGAVPTVPWHHVYRGESNLFRKVNNRLHYEALRFSRNWIYKRNISLGLQESFLDGRAHDGKSIIYQMPDCDVFHVHLLDTFVGYKWFFRQLNNNTPVVWTLHDNMPLTGGCQFNFGCERYLAGCGYCPQLYHRGSRDGSWQTFKRKKNILNEISANQITFISASLEQCVMAKSSPLTGKFEVLHIPLPINTSIYTPTDKTTAKYNLKVNGKKMAVGFAASSLGRPNKGFSVLAKAIKNSSRLCENIVLVLIGEYQRNGLINEDYKSINCEKIALGWISSETALAQAYNAMDILVVPSYQESFGQTVAEAMACGVPVIGSKVGGIQDQIIESKTGCLFPVGDHIALKLQLLKFLNNKNLVFKMSKNSRDAVAQKNSYSMIGKKHSDVYTMAKQKIHI